MLKECRERAGFTQERAYPELHIGLRTLQEYEKKDNAPPDVMLNMSRLYKQPEMTAVYCREMCPIGQIYCLETEVRNLPTAVLRLIKEFNDVKKMKDTLIEVTADGEVTPDEVDLLMEHMREIIELEHAIEELKLTVSRVIPVEKIIAQHNRGCKEKQSTRRQARCSA